jgi:hypothetical protein
VFRSNVTNQSENQVQSKIPASQDFVLIKNLENNHSATNDSNEQVFTKISVFIILYLEKMKSRFK